MNTTYLPAAIRCVRCGTRERQGDRFLCGDCVGNEWMVREMREAERRSSDFRAQRHFLVHEFHWAGGWPVIRERR